MADSKNSAPVQFDKDALKGWFTLAEVAERWRCSTYELIDFATVGHVEICHNFAQVAISWHIKRGTHPDDIYLFAVTDKIYWNGLLKVFRGDLMRVKAAPLSSIEPLSALRLPEGIRNGHEHAEHLAVIVNNDAYSDSKISFHNLVITKIERDRFEQEHGINQPGMTAKMPELDNEETENQRLKRTLAALVLGLSKQPKYKTGEKPNISNIVEFAISGVTPASGVTPRGYGNTTLTDAINSALKFSKGELDQ